VLGALKNKSNDAMKLNAVSISAPKKLSFRIIQISAQNRRLFPRAAPSTRVCSFACAPLFQTACNYPEFTYQYHYKYR
jgi:hypothetical protein